MNNRLINILIDFAFKQVFAGNGESSEIILKDFLNSILQLKDDDRIKEIVQLNPFNEREYIKDKQSIMDIKIKTEKDEYIDIEVQINDVDDYKDTENALKYLKITAEYAKELDENPDISEKVMRYYNFGPIYRETNLSPFMKIVMTEHYPLSDEFKSKPEFQEIIKILE